jgi:hypothetical protein
LVGKSRARVRGERGVWEVRKFEEKREEKRECLFLSSFLPSLLSFFVFFLFENEFLRENEDSGVGVIGRWR